MTILYPAPAPVKTARRFGAGILPPRPVRPFEPTPEERAWWAAESARLEENARFDQMAGESAYLDRHEAGLC